MGEKKNGYGIRAFEPGTPRGVKVRSVVFFIIVSFIGIELVVLLALYFSEEKGKRNQSWRILRQAVTSDSS
jgi:hypothetical protein